MTESIVLQNGNGIAIVSIPLGRSVQSRLTAFVLREGTVLLARRSSSNEGDSQMNAGQHWQKFHVVRPRRHAEDQL